MEKVEPSNTGGWSELPQELLEIIVAHLRFADHARFAAVCASWRLVAIGTRHHNALRLPWMLHFDDDHNLSTASSPSSDWESDWESREVQLVNPLSGRHIRLPNILKDPHTTWDGGPLIFNKVILSSSPLSGTCIVVARLVDEPKLALCRPFDASLVLFPSDEEWLYPKFIEDIIFHQGLLYAVDGQRQVTVYRFPNNPQQEDLNPEVVRVYSTNIPWPSKYFFVPSAEKLFMAAKYYSRGNDGCAELLFRVFVLNLEQKEWMKVKCLDDNVLFLSYNCSRSYKANHNSSTSGYSGGNIYYNGIYDVHSLKKWGAPLVQSYRRLMNKRSGNCWFVLN